MKTKLFKLLSVVMTLAMVFSMFACVVSAEEAPAYVVADTVEAGVAYKLGMIQEKVSATNVYYINGNMSSYYMATVTDPAAAIDVYLEAVEGGYNLSTTVNGAKKYINMVVSGTHVNGMYEDAASTVYTFDETNKILVSTVNDKEYAIGTRNDKTYTTVGPVATSYNGFHCQLYAAPKAEEPVPEDVIVEDGLYPAMESGNIYKDGAGNWILQEENPERILTINTYKVADFGKAIVASGYRVCFVFMDAEGNVLNKTTWLKGEIDIAAQGADSFRVSASADPNLNPFTPDMFPADGLKLVVKGDDEPETPVVPEEPKDVIVDGVLTPAMGKGTVNGVDMTASNSINPDSPRLYALNVYKVADYAEAIVAADCRIYIHFFKEDGKWLGGSGWLATGTHKLSTLSYAAGADVFRVTLSSTAGGNDLQTPPADGLKFTLADTIVDGVVTPVMAKGTVNGVDMTADNSINPDSPRLYAAKVYKVADFDEAIVAADCRIYVHFFKEDGKWLGGSGWLATGTHKLSTLPNAAGADVFRVTLSSTAGGNDLQTPPADGLKFTVSTGEEPETPETPDTPDTPVVPEEPEVPAGNPAFPIREGDVYADGVVSPLLASGTVNGAPKTLADCVAEHAIRLYTVNTYDVAEVDSIVVSEGCRAFVQYWFEDGTYCVGSGWQSNCTYKIAKDNGAKYFKITFDSADGATTPPVDGLKFNVPTISVPLEPEFPIQEGDTVEGDIVSPLLASGTVNGAPKTLADCVAEHAIRLYTVNTYDVAEVISIDVAEGCRAFVQYWFEDGTYCVGSGWQSNCTYKIAKDNGAKYFKITFDSADGTTTPPVDGLKFKIPMVAAADFPLEEGDTIDGAIVSPLMASGTVNGAPKTLETCVAEHATRLYTVNNYKTENYLQVIVGEGTRAFVQYWDADGVYNSGDGWLAPGTHAIKGDNGSTYFKITFSSTVGGNDAQSPAADALKLVAKVASAPHDCEVAEYTSNNDATCLEDGTKSGICTVCGKTVTVKDEFSAKGHTFADGEDKCSVCGEARPSTDNCEHTYGEYKSNGDATCEDDGTKSATCLKCGNVDTVADKDSALGHKVEYVNDNNATCDKNATESGLCANCNETITKEIPNSYLGHLFGSDDDDYCTRGDCDYTRKRVTYYVAESKFGGADTNTGTTAEAPLGSVEKAIILANEAGYGIGDIVTINVKGAAELGGHTMEGESDAWRGITAHTFKVVFVSDDGKGTVVTNKRIIFGGQMVFDTVGLHNTENWMTFGLNGFSATFNTELVSDQVDFALVKNRNLKINQVANYQFNVFFSKIWVGGTYGIVDYNKEFTLALNQGTDRLKDDGTPSTTNIVLAGMNRDDTTNYNAPSNIIFKMPNFVQITAANKVKIGENGFLNFINTVPENKYDLSALGFTEDAIKKVWFLDVAPMATIEGTDVAGEFKVQSGFIATATPVEGDAITSAAGKLVVPAGQYSISFTMCTNHVYDDDLDATCNKCNDAREVFAPCEHVWSEYVFDENADCETLGTETRVCAECGEEETRNIEGVAPGHIYGEDLFCAVCGKYQILEPTLVKMDDGTWKYFVNGEWDTTATTLHWLSGKWFFVENGVWSKASRIITYKGVEFYVSGGKWDKTITDLKWVGGVWYYIHGGKPARNVDTLHKINGKWFLVKKGVWKKTTGIVEYKGKDFYVVGGKWQSQETLYKKSGKLLAIKGGKWYKSKGIVKYNGKKYYVNKGYAQTSFSGKVTISGKKYTVKKGIIK